jgi:hydroxyacylglutathione hydrolase
MGKLGIVKVKLDREVNGYVLSCSTTKEALVIDPGLPPEKLAEQTRGLSVKYIVATHGHPGHVAGKDDLKEITGGETAIHSADAKQFLRSADRYLLDGDELEFGEFKAAVLHTPGHTPGSICLVIANHAFVGDTLLAGGIGKQMPETDLRRQMMSIGTKLMRLPLSTALYPGHGPATSLEREDHPAGGTTDSPTIALDDGAAQIDLAHRETEIHAAQRAVPLT